ncbi:MAG: beta-propeller fold lactonase family protein [Pseudomonadota bacterium]
MHLHNRLKRSLLAAITCACGTVPPALAEQQHSALDLVQARAVLVIHDGKFNASTYRDAVLSDESMGHKDMLTVLQPGNAGAAAELGVSNSVTGPPEVLAVSPDGRYAYVVERLGQRKPGASKTADLAPGRLVTAIDLTDLAKPTIVSTVKAGPMIESVRVSPDGRFLALTANGPDSAMLQIVPVVAGQLGEPRSFALETLGVERRPDGARGGINATFADWHPSGRLVSVNLNTRNEVAFFNFEASQGPITLTPSGSPVTVGLDPFVGRFTPDGNHYITADWGRNFKATDLAGRLPTAASRLSLIRLSGRDRNGRTEGHKVVANVETDRSSEGIAISQDGLHVATINMRETALATDSPRHTKKASISYFQFEARTSTLKKIGDYQFEGVLPEGGTFDASGKHFIASVFEYAGAARGGGGLEVWSVNQTGTAGLTPVGRVALPHGAHHVEIVP